MRQLHQPAIGAFHERKRAGRNVLFFCFRKDACQRLEPEVKNLSEVFAIAQTAIGNLLVHELGLYTEMNLMFSRLSHHRMSLAVEEDVRDEDLPVGSECCRPVRKAA